MREVIIAPAALLGKSGQERNAQPINTTPHLPLGNKSANIEDKQTDDYKTIDYKWSSIADRTARNAAINTDHKYAKVEMALVGKKSSVGAKHSHDQQAMVDTIKKMDDRETLRQYNNKTKAQFNLVATPFVQAKSIYPEILDT